MYFVYGLTLIITTIHLINYLQGKVPLLRKSFLDIPLTLFIISQVVSTLFSINPHLSIFGYYSRLNGGLLSLITYSILYWILAIYINENLKQKIIHYSIISASLVSIYAILQHFGVDQHYWQQDVVARVFSTFGQPNWLAAYLCILLPIILHRLLNSKTNVLRITYYVLLTVFYLSLLFTKSRSGILAAIISLGLFGIYYFFKNQNKKLLITVYGLLITLSLIINNPIKDQLFPQKLTSDNLKSENLRSDILITPSEDIRTIVWQGAISIWRQFPIFGTGPETFADAYYWVRPASHNLTSEWNFLYNKAHNEYLNYLATTGTFGFLSYLILILSIIYSLIRNLKFEIRNLAILSSIASILITNFAGFSIVTISLYFFLLPALVLEPLPPSQHKPPLFLKLFSVFLIINSSLLIISCLKYYLADISYAQAENYDRQQKYAQALQSINISLNYRPNEPTYLINHGTLLSKIALTTQDPKYIQSAIRSLEEATSISPFNLNLWKEKSQAYYYLSALDSDYYLLTIDSLTKATKLAPTDAISFYLLAQSYDRIKRYDEAIIFYQKAIELKPNYDHATFALGQVYFDQKKYQLAKPLFEKTLIIAPTNLEAKDYLARIATMSSTK